MQLDDNWLAQKADNIRAHFARSVFSIVSAGRELQEVKDELQHGQWGRWIDREFGFTDRTAQRYMDAAQFLSQYFSDGEIKELQAQPVALYEVARTSQSELVQEQAITLLRAGQFLSRAVVNGIIEGLLRAEKTAEYLKTAHDVVKELALRHDVDPSAYHKR